jgi:ubiquitin-activating enzyme E1
LYNNIFPRHKERLNKRVSELVSSVANADIPEWRSHFDVVVACEEEDGDDDIDVPWSASRPISVGRQTVATKYYRRECSR